MQSFEPKPAPGEPIIEPDLPIVDAHHHLWARSEAALAAVESNTSVAAQAWRAYIETCVEAFGVGRCMFESNFPVDAATTTYPVLWNAFKRSVEGASREEKLALFGATAARIYRLDVDNKVSHG